MIKYKYNFTYNYIVTVFLTILVLYVYMNTMSILVANFFLIIYGGGLIVLYFVVTQFNSSKIYSKLLCITLKQWYESTTKCLIPLKNKNFTKFIITKVSAIINYFKRARSQSYLLFDFILSYSTVYIYNNFIWLNIKFINFYSNLLKSNRFFLLELQIKHKKMDLYLWFKDQKWNLELYSDEYLYKLNSYLNTYKFIGDTFKTRIEIFSFGHIKEYTLSLNQFYMLVLLLMFILLIFIILIIWRFITYFKTNLMSYKYYYLWLYLLICIVPLIFHLYYL